MIFDGVATLIRRTRGPILVAVAAVGLSSCGDSPVAPFVPVASTVAIQPTSVGLSWLGETTVVEATVRDQNGDAMGGVDLVWSSADAAIATVSEFGAVTARGDGTTVVTARVGAIIGTVSVSVARDVATLLLGADSVVLADPGDDAALMLFAADAGGAEISTAGVVWSSSDSTIVSVDQDGVVTAVSTGLVTITATAGGVSESLTVRVAPQLTLSLVGETVVEGTVDAEASLSARVRDLAGSAYAGAKVVWSVGLGSGTILSSDVSTSDASGFVGAVWQYGTTAGTQRAFASFVSRGDTVIVEFLAEVRAGAPVAAALVADSVLISAIGETAFLSPTYVDGFGNPTTGSGVIWTSRDPAVVTVSEDGLLTGAGAGTTWVVGSLSSPVDSIEVGVIERGAITITFDDGWRTVYENGWPVFQDFNLRANVGVYTSAVGWPAYMTEAHLDELHDAGWSMVSHTVSHDTVTTLSPAELDFELRASQEWLDARGYRGSDVIVIPYHEFDEPQRIASSTYYTAARGASAGEFAPDTLVSWLPSNPYMLTGIDADVLPYTTVAGRDRLRALLQRTVDEGAFLDVYFHHIPPANVAAFRATLAVLEEFEDRVLPYHELFPAWARGIF